MMTLWTIKVLNALFICSLGAVILWLIYSAIDWDRSLKRAQSGKTHLFLSVLRDGCPYLRVPLKDMRYSIGREAVCDIPLKGAGIPIRVGEIRPCEGGCIVAFSSECACFDERSTVPDKRVTLKSGKEMALFNYTIRLDEF